MGQVEKHPVAEELAQWLHGIEMVPTKDQKRMVNRACKEMARFVDEHYIDKNIVGEAVKELSRPTCVDYEYDPTPTERDRIRNAKSILSGKSLVSHLR